MVLGQRASSILDATPSPAPLPDNGSWRVVGRPGAFFFYCLIPYTFDHFLTTMTTDLSIIACKFRLSALRRNTLISIASGVVAGIVLTCIVNVRTGTLSLTDSTMYNTLGYNNLCVFIDELPGRYVAFPPFQLGSIIWTVYEFASYSRYRAEFSAGLRCLREYRMYTATCWFCALAFLWFPSVFIVHPSANFAMHTLPFTFVVVATVVNATRELLLGGVSHYPMLETYPRSIHGGVAFFFITGFVKVWVQFEGIMGRRPPLALARGSDMVYTFIILVIGHILLHTRLQDPERATACEVRISFPRGAAALSLYAPTVIPPSRSHICR